MFQFSKQIYFHDKGTVTLFILLLSHLNIFSASVTFHNVDICTVYCITMAHYAQTSKYTFHPVLVFTLNSRLTAVSTINFLQHTIYNTQIYVTIASSLWSLVVSTHILIRNFT
jgi:hypothetical protein